MGGYIQDIVETRNYKFQFHVNLSGDAPRYRLGVVDKRDESLAIEMRTREYDYVVPETERFDRAVQELEEEREERRAYMEMTEEQITLSEMWRRMVEAERDVESLRAQRDDMAKAMLELDRIWGELKRAKDRRGWDD